MTTDVLLFTPGASTLKYWRLQRLRHKYLPVSWDFVLILLPLHFMLQRKRQMQSQPCPVINKGKRKAFVVQRKAKQLPSECSSFPDMWCLWCMHFPNTSVSDTSLHPGHTVRKQLICQLMSLSLCLLRLARFTKHSVCFRALSLHNLCCSQP